MPDVWRIVYHAYSAYIPLLGRTPPTFLEDFDSHVALGNLWLLDNGIEPSAMAVLTPAYDHVMIQALCVDPQLQGRGLGRKTLLFAEQYARSLKIYQLKLYTNSLMLRNLKIYPRCRRLELGREAHVVLLLHPALGPIANPWLVRLPGVQQRMRTRTPHRPTARGERATPLFLSTSIFAIT